MITPQKMEWMSFIKTNITYLGENVYPEFSKVDRLSDTFCVVEIFVLNSEKMITGTMYNGFARLTFVAPDPKVMDYTLIDKFGDELELRYTQFVSLTCYGVTNVTEPKPYTPEKENVIKREVDIKMSWYKGT